MHRQFDRQTGRETYRAGETEIADRQKSTGDETKADRQQERDRQSRLTQ